MQAGCGRLSILARFHRGQVAFLHTPACQPTAHFSQHTCTVPVGRTTSRTPVSICNPIFQAARQSVPGRMVPFLQSQQIVTVQRMFGTCGKCLQEDSKKEVANRSAASAEEDQITRVAASEHHEQFSARAATEFDKKLLVFFKKYKTTDEVPSLVSVHLLNATRNKFRVYFNMFIGFLTLSCCSFMIYRGHSRVGQGDTLAMQNMKRHPEHYQKQLKE